MPGLFIGYLLIIIIYRMLSTIRYIHYGWKNFMKNWYESMFIEDMKKFPEIVPGIEGEERIDKSLKLSSVFSTVRTKNMNLITKIFNFVISYGFLYLLVIVYRISIKATFWFYSPLLLLVKSPSALDNSRKIGSFLSSLCVTKIAIWRFWFAIIILLSFIVTHFDIAGFNEWSSSFIYMKLLFYLDYSKIELWQFIQIFVAIISIGLYFYSDHIKTTKIDSKIELFKNDFSIKTILFFNDIRNSLSFFYFLSAFIILCSYFKVWENKYVPNFFNEFLTTLVEYISITPS